MKKLPLVLFACLALTLHAQAPSRFASAPASAGAGSSGSAAAPDPNAAKARTLLDRMVQALGGQRWLSVQNSYISGSMAAFYEGKPTGDDVNYWQWSTPTATRIDLGVKKHDNFKWVQIYQGGRCWEITYQGRKAMLPKTCAAFNREYSHSIRTAVRDWLPQPTTLLLYDGQRMVETHLADEVTLLNDRNDAVTIRTDVESHLPLSCSWTWRDPVYHDKDSEIVEYADYHPIDGLPTPFSITYILNGSISQQRFILNAGYNVPLPPDGFDLDAITDHIMHR